MAAMGHGMDDGSGQTAAYRKGGLKAKPGRVDVGVAVGIETEAGVPIDEWVADGTWREDASDVGRWRVHDDA